MFATGWGDPIHADSVGWLMTKTIRAYNDPKDGPRAGRAAPPRVDARSSAHHATTLLLAAGVPVNVLAARLGHADPAITLRVYAHAIHEAEVAAAEVIAEAA